MPDAGALPLLEVEITHKSHARNASRLEVIAGLRFSLQRGEVTCLLGPSGCGKSTALRIVMGLDASYAGRVEPSIETLRLGVVFQDPRLLPWRTVEENVRLAAPSLTSEALSELLDEVGLGEWRTARPNQLSGGMARRAALARALAVEPDLMILDEAFVSLDERNAEMLRSVVFTAIERRKATALMVTHDVREAVGFADEILVMAPRPTRILGNLRIETPKKQRDEACINHLKGRLAALQDVNFQTI